MSGTSTRDPWRAVDRASRRRGGRRPFLTALAVSVGSAVILFDPIFQGLALSLAAGEVASLLISRMAVPVLYAMVRGRERPSIEPEPADRHDGLEVLQGGVSEGVANFG